MSRVVLGAICGLAFGAIDVGIMLPMTFPDKKQQSRQLSLRASESDLSLGRPACRGQDGV